MDIFMERAKPSKPQDFTFDSTEVDRMEEVMQEEFYEKEYFLTILQAAAIIYTRTIERATAQQFGLAKILFKILEQSDQKGVSWFF